MTDPYLPLSEVFKTLAHPVRLRILEALVTGEASVSRLTILVEQRQAYVSQQLMLLREAGLVRDRREGSTVYYGLAFPQVIRFLGEARSLLLPAGDSLDVQVELPKDPGIRPYQRWNAEED